MKRRERLARANARLRTEMRNFNRAFDASIGPLPPAVSCHKGCSGCCKQITLMTLLEAAYIVATHPERVRRALPRLREQAAFIDSELGGKDPFGPERNEAARAKLAGKWWARGESCVLLENGECSVYAERPFVCRAYFVTSDPVLCGVPETAEVLQLVGPWYTDGALSLYQANADFYGDIVGYFPSMLTRAWDAAQVST
jgi:Fe-S-cluster containining protein